MPHLTKGDFNIDMSCTDLNRLIKTSNDQNVANLGKKKVVLLKSYSFSQIYKKLS